jgi:hypothetical protein
MMQSLEGGGNGEASSPNNNVYLAEFSACAKVARRNLHGRLNREAAERELRHLLPNGRVEPADLERPASSRIADLLWHHQPWPRSDGLPQGIRNRAGFQIAWRAPPEGRGRSFPHWTFGPTDLFRGIGREGRGGGPNRNTDPDLLSYPVFEVDSQAPLSGVERLWFQSIQRLLPTRFRQHIQFSSR